MKRGFRSSCAAACIVLAVTGCYAAKSVSIDSTEGKLSYALGMVMGHTFKAEQVAIDPALFYRGFNAIVQQEKTAFSLQKARNIVEHFELQVQHKARMAVLKQAKDNLKNGEAFLAKNKTQPGVKVTDKGLQYKVVVAGKGAHPGARDKVTVNYEGRLINGKIFDSSYQRGAPSSFAVNQVIPGWQEALQKMRVGATWELYIPAALAYGEHGPGDIGPNQVLVFKVELLSIKKTT